MLANPFVNSFVMPAKNNQVLFERQLISRFLFESFAVGGHVNHLIIRPFGLQRPDTTRNGFNLHNHPALPPNM